MNTGTIYSELTGKIGRVRRKQHSISMQTGIINTVAASAAIWTVAISVEALLELDPAGRTALYWSAVGLSGVCAALLAGPRLGRYFGLLRGQDDDTIARRVGGRIPEIGDSLVNTLQLYRGADAGALVAGYSPELVQASIALQGEPLRHYDYSVIIEDEERKRAFLFILGSAALLGGLFLAFPATYGDALYRLTHYRQEFIKPAPFALQIAPGDRKLLRGDSVEITVRATGIPPRTMKLSLQSGEAAPEEVELRGDSAGVFRYMVPSIKATTIFYAYSGPVRTPEHTFLVVERPEIRILRATLTSPAYTRRGVERLPDNVGDVSGIRGAAVNLQVTTSIPPATATIVQLFPRAVRIASADAGGMAAPASYDTVRIPMTISGTTVAGGFRLSRDGEYYIAIASPDGLTNSAPIHYHMSVSTDGPPSITLLEPTGPADISEKMLLPTEVRIADDYGFSRLRIMYRLAASKYAEPMKEFRPHPIPIPSGGASAIDVPYIWDMSGMNMVPEDEVEIYFEVYDNDAVSGPKVARTSTLKVRFPSLEEVLRGAEQTQAQASADLDKMLKQAEEGRKEMEAMNRELMKQMAQNKQQAGWQEKQKLQEMMRQHEAMEQKMEKIAEDLRAVAEKLQEARAISPETLKKYEDLQKLFQELKNPQMMEQMRKMQDAMEKMTPEQMAEAMKNYKFNEEQFRKSIERTMNILKRMQTEQKVDEMIRRADELQRQQENLNNQMEGAEQQQDKAMQQQLADRQEQLARQAEKMKQETADLAKQMADQEDMPTKEMQEAEQSLEQNDPQEQMKGAQQQMQNGQMEKAQQQGEKARQAAQDFQQKMQAVKKKMQENSQRNVTNKMKKSMQDLLELSKRQEQLKKQTEQTQPNSQQFRDLAQQQQQMEEQMENIANQMMSLGQKSFAVTPEMGRELGNAMRQMQGATQQLEQRNGQQAAQNEGQAMSSMNSAAKMMGDALAQMQNGQQQGQGMGMGMGSMQQRLQQMAAQQQMLNQAMGQQQGQGQGQGQEGEGQGQGEGKGKQGKNGKEGEGENGQGEGEGSGKEGKNGREMQRLTNQQGQIKKSIEEMNREIRESGGTRKNIVGDLERAAREIDEVLNDMRSGQVTPETIQRQEKILSRLLDATRSNRERDFEKERESKSGVDVVRQSPPDLKLGEAEKDGIRRDALNSREQGYTKDYEYMIRRYFEALGTNPAARQ